MTTTDMFSAASLLVSIGMVVALVDISVHLRRVWRRLERFPLPWPDDGGGGTSHHTGAFKALRFSIWICEGGLWVLLQPCGQKGCKCLPALERGVYEGEVIRKECPPVSPK